MSFNPITVAQGADGYLTFFTGTDGLAGDNDATYSRVTGTIRTVGAFQGSPSISGTGVGGVGHTGTAFIWDAVSNAGASGGISSRFDTSFQSQTDVYRWRIGGNFTPAGVAFGFFDNVPNIWMKTGTPPLTGFNEVAPVNVIDVGGGMVIGTTYAGTNTAPSNGLLVEGNVGLGTTSPQNKLDIEGAAAIGAGYSGTSTAPTNGLIVEGSVGVGTTTPDQTLHVHKGTAGTVSANASSVIVMENSVNAYLHMLTPHANESGILAGGPDSSIKTALLFNNQAAINFRSGGNTTRMTLSADGNLGIGPASGTPHATLTVNGNIALQEQAIDPPFQDGYGYLYVRDDDKLYYKDGAGVEFDLTSGGGVSATQGSDGYLSFFTGANTIAGDNDLYWDRVNNILGIGISNPSSISPNATLSVASPHESVRINVVSGVVQGTATIGFYGSPTSFAYAGVVAYHTNQGDGGSGHLAFNTDDGTSHQERMRILDTGNIGIGTASPHEKLTLNGVMSLQEQDTYNRTFDGYGSLWAKSDGSIHFTNDAGTDYNLTAAAGLSAEQGADGYLAFFTSGNTLAGDNDLFYNRTTGQLQVTSDAVAPININHTGAGAALHIIDDNVSSILMQRTVATTAQWALAMASDGVFLIRDMETSNSIIAIQKAAPTGSIYIESTGDVGFSTLTPVARLELEDNATANGMIMKVTADDHNVYGIIIGNDTFSTTDANGLGLYLSNAGVSVIDAAGTSTSLSLQIAATERVRITTTGVGLGTSAPQNRLDVEGAAVVGVTYSGTNTAPSNGMLIEGVVGIGTASPDTTNTKVEIQQTLSSTTTSSLFLENTSTGDVMLTLGLTGARYYSWGIDNSDSDNFKLATATAMGSGVDTNTIMVVTSAGNVGVGGTPVNGKFEVNTTADSSVVSTAYASAAGANARGVLQARANGGGVILGMNNTTHSEYTRGGENMNSAAELVTFNAGDAVTKFLIGNVNAAPIHFITNNAKVMTISSDSLVGIKTSTPIEALTVNGVVALEEQGSTPVTQDGYGKLYTSSDGDLTYKDDGGSVVQITHADGYVNWTPSWINVIVKDADTGGDANEHTFPVDANWTGGSVDATITGKGIYFNSVNGQFNITKAGIYRFFAQIPWSDSDTNTGNITFRVKRNDGTAMWLFDERWNNSTDVSPKTTVIDFIVEVPAGETLEMTWNPRNTAALINPLGSWFTIGIQQISM